MGTSNVVRKLIMMSTSACTIDW